MYLLDPKLHLPIGGVFGLSPGTPLSCQAPPCSNP